MNLDKLAVHLRDCPYPEPMSMVDRGILGLGFYPGARGFPVNSPPPGGIMLLGRDWGTKKDYDGFSGEPARNESASTWRNTRDFYLSGLPGIPVWCTNYLMGVRKDGKATGNIKKVISAEDWPVYEAGGWSFLHRQVFLQKPVLIVVFGGFNQEDLSAPNRLGVMSTEFSKYVFELHGDRHSASVTFADHPHSLIPPVKREEARNKVGRIKSYYESMKLQ